MLRKLTEAKSVKYPIPRQQEVYMLLNRKEGSNCSWEGTLTQEETREFAKNVDRYIK